MAFQPVQDGVVAVVNQTVHGEVANTVLYFKGPILPNVTQLTQLATQIRGIYVALWLPQCAQSYSLVNVETRDVSTDGGIFASSPAAPPALGDLGLNGAPGNVSFAVKHLTERSGRSYRGRSYVCGFPASFIVGNELATSTIAAAVNLFNQIRIDAQNLGFTFSVCSRFENKQPRQVAILTPVTLSTGSDTTVDSQRRRLPGRGV